MEGDIQFGEVEELEPQPQLRPDQNRHYAVVAYGAPAVGELPVYVDIDVMRDMETHARSNTQVELGGVMLGGHYKDRDGRPFVLITDSLRAEHYEATKGSFKFTHDTWSEFTRKRAEYPDEIQMVGWYHTHPDWGVFLSGMDTYICDHFFNKPLDVALVIDPCQGDRAFFEWTIHQGARQTRPTKGFYLIASRFRLAELEDFKAELEGTLVMSRDPRSAGYPGYPPPVVHITEPRQTWLAVAVLGMLLMQFCLLALIAWRMFDPRDPVASVQLKAEAAELDAERKMLDKVIGELQVAPDGLVQSLEEERRANEDLKTSRLGLSVHISEQEKLLAALRADKKQLEEKQQKLLETNDDLKALRRKEAGTIKQLKDRLKEYEGDEEAGDDPAWWAWMKRWKWYLTGGALLILAIVVGLFAYYGPPPEGEEPAAPPPPAEEDEGEPEA